MIKFNFYKNIFFLFIISFFISNPLIAFDNTKLNINYGVPTSKQNISIRKLDLELYKNILELNNKTDIDFYIGLGSFILKKNDYMNCSTGLGISYKLFRNLNLNLIGKIKYLDNYIFNEGLYSTKNYGGHFQFYASISTNILLKSNFNLGYRLDHMSNGNMYNVNPALDCHNITITYNF